ncbi:hypothetical protein PAPYR_12821 [Paratrimastix pyriformis]|uniref:Uncharacterized protein n=1 Tax=Paratrimastix pyriformis TaxID=342808 RepID=A0ABQ8U190_9EUKA|nr:hypothetical protein PAPYR_12821 [Paratrimastix pyriformis]
MIAIYRLALLSRRIEAFSPSVPRISLEIRQIVFGVSVICSRRFSSGGSACHSPDRTQSLLAMRAAALFVVFFAALLLPAYCAGDGLWGVGSNYCGSGSSSEPAPIVVPTGCTISDVYTHPLAERHFVLCENGRLYAAGLNSNGNLCLGHKFTAPSLNQVTLPAGKSLRRVVPGKEHTILVMTDGSLYGCGAAAAGEHGHMGTVSAAHPGDIHVIMIIVRGNNGNYIPRLPACFPLS